MRSVSLTGPQHASMAVLRSALHRRHLNVRGKSANLPAITEKDWDDIKFGVDVGVDYYALSFVRSADVIYELKRWLSKRDAKIGVLAKIESADSVQHLEEILDAVDGAMVARGDLGAELPVEKVGPGPQGPCNPHVWCIDFFLRLESGSMRP